MAKPLLFQNQKPNTPNTYINISSYDDNDNNNNNNKRTTTRDPDHINIKTKDKTTQKARNIKMTKHPTVS